MKVVALLAVLAAIFTAQAKEAAKWDTHFEYSNTGRTVPTLQDYTPGLPTPLQTMEFGGGCEPGLTYHWALRDLPLPVKISGVCIKDTEYSDISIRPLSN